MSGYIRVLSVQIFSRGASNYGVTERGPPRAAFLERKKMVFSRAVVKMRCVVVFQHTCLRALGRAAGLDCRCQRRLLPLPTRGGRGGQGIF